MKKTNDIEKMIVDEIDQELLSNENEDDGLVKNFLEKYKETNSASQKGKLKKVIKQLVKENIIKKIFSMIHVHIVLELQNILIEVKKLVKPVLLVLTSILVFFSLKSIFLYRLLGGIVLIGTMIFLIFDSLIEIPLFRITVEAIREVIQETREEKEKRGDENEKKDGEEEKKGIFQKARFRRSFGAFKKFRKKFHEKQLNKLIEHEKEVKNRKEKIEKGIIEKEE